MIEEIVTKEAAARLARDKFALVSQDVEGPIGSGRWRFSDGLVALEVHNDRGTFGCGMGPVDDATFEVGVWSQILNVAVEAEIGLEEQIAFFIDNIVDIRSVVANDPGVAEKLRKINWILVKQRLGLPPGTKRPGE